MGKVVNVICSGCGGSGRIGVGLCGGCNGARLNKVCDACGAHHPCAAPGSRCLSCSYQGVTTVVHVDDTAELKARIVELHRELAQLRGQLATAREDASEMEKKAIAEGGEALALRAEVAALKASTTVVHVDESLRMAMDRENAELKARIAELEAWLPIEESPEKRDLLVTDGYSVVIGDRFRNFWNGGVDSLSCAPTHFRALPEPPKPTGDGQ